MYLGNKLQWFGYDPNYKRGALDYRSIRNRGAGYYYVRLKDARGKPIWFSKYNRNRDGKVKSQIITPEVLREQNQRVLTKKEIKKSYPHLGDTRKTSKGWL